MGGAGRWRIRSGTSGTSWRKRDDDAPGSAAVSAAGPDASRVRGGGTPPSPAGGTPALRAWRDSAHTSYARAITDQCSRAAEAGYAMSECEQSTAALIAVSAVMESFGRSLICLDRDFRIVHTSGTPVMDGRPVAELLGSELFALDGALRHVLERGERREGWRASMALPDGTTRLVSCSAAPFKPDSHGICDPRVAYVIIVRPAEEDPSTGTASPTGFSGMIARSAAMTRLFHLVDNLQASDATILLTGESGTGKEVLAHAIHANSARKGGRFVAVNCAALPGELLESELFGHVRGAFTGAVRDRLGRVELAAGGTLFLDEIGDVPLHLQAKLLRVLQERTYERVGESVTHSSDARIIA